MRLPTLICAGLEETINRMLALDPDTQAGFEQLHGKVIGFHLPGPELELFLAPGPGRVQVLSSYEGEPDCRISGNLIALTQMNDRRKSGQKLNTGEVKIAGDTELAHQFGNLLSDLDIDWEEQLSKVFGDLIAHRLGSLFRQAGDWGKGRSEAFTSNLGEYLQEELRLLPVRLEIEEFLADVDALRDDVERLQARLKLLSAKLENSG